MAIAWTNTSSASGSTVNDSGDGNWTLAASNGSLGMWYVCNAAGGSTAVTINGGGANWYGLHLIEASGNLTSSCLDTTGNGSATNVTPTATTGTLSHADLLIFGAGTANNVTSTPPSGETVLQTIVGAFNLNSFKVYNNLLASSGTPTMKTTLSSSVAWNSAIGAFKLASSYSPTFR